MFLKLFKKSIFNKVSRVYLDFYNIHIKKNKIQSLISISSNKKQYFFNIIKKKSYFFSTGHLFYSELKYKGRYEKKISILVYLLKKKLEIKNFCMLLLNNYNFKLNKFIKKYFNLVKPNIKFLIIKLPHNNITKKKSRIKRSVLKNLVN